MLEGLARVRHHLAEAGRTEVGFGTEMLLTGVRGTDKHVDSALRWQDAGGTNISVVTMGSGLTTAAEHIDHMAAMKAALAARL